MSTAITVTLDQIGPTTSEGHARKHKVLVDRPQAKEGNDRGPMGGEYLLIGLGGCFMSNLPAAIRAREAQISDIHVTVEGTLEGNPKRFTKMLLTVAADFDDLDLMEKLVTMSERACISANTLKNGVELAVTLQQ
jgi:putative redox protein